MEEKVLLDTNVIINLLKHGDHLERVIELGRHGVWISIVTYYEIYVGIEMSSNKKLRARKLRAFEQLLQHINICPFNVREASTAAEIRAELQKSGKLIGPLDILIAGIARTHDYLLVTGNLKEFERVNDLQVECWNR